MDRQAVIEWLKASREASGVPAKIEDPVVLRRIAVLLHIAEQTKPGRKR